ncbi:MAG: hypothetical protein ACYS72_04750 [Planctomycetota bacterium]|jgi:hypothetical protein
MEHSSPPKENPLSKSNCIHHLATKAAWFIYLYFCIPNPSKDKEKGLSQELWAQ